MNNKEKEYVCIISNEEFELLKNTLINSCSILFDTPDKKQNIIIKLKNKIDLFHNIYNAMLNRDKEKFSRERKKLCIYIIYEKELKEILNIINQVSKLEKRKKLNIIYNKICEIDKISLELSLDGNCILSGIAFFNYYLREKKIKYIPLIEIGKYELWLD